MGLCMYVCAVVNPLSLSIYIYQSVRPSVNLLIHLSVCLSVYLSHLTLDVVILNVLTGYLQAGSHIINKYKTFKV